MALRMPLAGGLGLAAVLLTATPAKAVQEVTVYGVANFGGAGECGGGFTSHARHTTSAANFRAPFNTMIAAGTWDEANTNNNLDAHGTYFTDPAEGSSTDHSCCESYQSASCSCLGQDGNSGTGADQGDIFFIHTHGGSTHLDEITDGGTVPYMGLQMGNTSYDCRPRSHQDWELGNGTGDLEIAVVEACQSMDYEVWDDGGHWQFSESSSVFNMFNAYHGNVSCSDSRTAEIGDYSDASIFDGAGDNWLDMMYSNTAAANGDNCPVSVVFGSSDGALRQHMYDYGGWRDREDTGSKTNSTIFYIGGCDPAGGSVLP